MFGLVVLLIMFGYLAVAVTATVLTVRSVKRAGGGRRDQWIRGGLVALVFYLIPFWDLAPNWIAYEYLCATEGRLEIRKSLQQWEAENGALEKFTLRDKRDSEVLHGGGVGHHLSERISSVSYPHKHIFMSVWNVRYQLVDREKGEILVNLNDYRIGKTYGLDEGRFWTFWIKKRSCSGGDGDHLDAYFSISGKVPGTRGGR